MKTEELIAHFAPAVGQPVSAIDALADGLLGRKYSGGGPLKAKHIHRDGFNVKTPGDEHERLRLRLSDGPSVVFIAKSGVVERVDDGSLYDFSRYYAESR